MKDWFQQTVQRLTHTHRLWVAFSGGLDSRVLLDLTVQAFAQQADYQIGVIHIHDGLSQYADDWVAYCQVVCQKYQLPLEIRWIDASQKPKQSPEESSRIARYQALLGCLAEQDCLLLAHHQEDQAETILLRLFRGTGPLGLGGMKERVVVEQKEMIRPLLSVSKAQLREYAALAGLDWVEDDLNREERFDRNYVRHQLMPMIKKRWPKVSDAITRSGQIAGDVASTLEEAMQEKLEYVLDSQSNQLSVRRLSLLDSRYQGHVLRLWLKNLGYPMPSQAHLHRILREVVFARPGAKPRLKIDQYELYRQSDQLGVRPWVVS